MKSKYPVGAFDFRLAPGSLEHRIYWSPEESTKDVLSLKTAER